MSPQEQQSILSIALLAAFADGNKADAERESDPPDGRHPRP